MTYDTTCGWCGRTYRLVDPNDGRGLVRRTDSFSPFRCGPCHRRHVDTLAGLPWAELVAHCERILAAR